MPKDRKSYNREYKIDVVRKWMESNKTAKEVAMEEGISIVSINRWKKEYKDVIGKSSVKPEGRKVWTSTDKFNIVVESLMMNELELGEYCRENGLYREQILEWKESCMGANEKKVVKDDGLAAQLKAEQKAKKELEKDLRKKEKALAEVAALLVLSKKANAIWGEPEED